MFLKLGRDLHFGEASCDATKNRLYFGAESRFKFAVVACGAFHHCLQPAKDAELEENKNKRMHYRGIEPSILWSKGMQANQERNGDADVTHTCQIRNRRLGMNLESVSNSASAVRV